MVPRQAWIGCLLAFGGCGGLAADGHGPDGVTPCPPGQTCAGSAIDGDAEPRRPARDGTPAEEAAEELGRGPAAAAGLEPGVAPGGRVGSACEAPSAADERGESVTVGEVSLAESEGCGVGNLCLARAQPGEATCSTASGAGGVCPDERILPIPPALAPVAPRGRVCTCRCGGFDEGAEYCSCPAGMTCRELIRTLGTNGAALAYAGSYCLY